MKTSGKLIGNLVHRVSIRLPYKSGRKIEAVEQDPIVKQTVAAIIELSKYKLSIVANTLGSVLESVSKTHQIFEQNVPVETMQSKLFVLRLLSACMQHHWQHCRNLEKEKNKDVPVNELNVVPPPLDAALVTFLLVLMSRYITQYHLIEESTNLDQNSNISPIVDFSESECGYTYEQKKLSLITDIYKAASKILYYISASNWDACYSKIKNAVLSLDSMKSSSDKIPPEIRMLESSCLTKNRLSTIFTELSSHFLHMRNEGKLLLSKMLRKAIWKWVEEYPSEFYEVCSSDKHVLAGSEVLFDMCSATADNSKKRAILWPLQTILLVLSPEFLIHAFLDTAPAHNRRANFLTLLKKSLQSTRSADIACMCYVDLCKAATCVPPNNESILRSIAADIEGDVKDKVWDFKRIPGFDNSLSMYTIDQQSITTDFMLSQLRLHPEKTLNEVVPTCIPENVPILFKLAFVKSCLIIIQDEKLLSWNPTISSMYNGLCTPLRKLFLQTVYLDLNNSVMNKKRETYSNHSNRIKLLLDMLRLFKTDPKLAILGNDSDRIKQNAQFMVGLMDLFQHPVPRIKQGAIELLVKMHQSDYIVEWGPSNDILYNFWKISSPVILNLAQNLLDSKINEESIMSLLQLLNKLLKLRNTFLKAKESLSLSEYANMRERLQASVILEIALLLSLCSANKDICDEASQCISHLCKEARLVDIKDERDINPLTLASNIDIYEELSSDDSRYIGRKAQQKRIRRCLRMLPYHTPGNMRAWEEAWKRWKHLTFLMNKLSEENDDDSSTEASIGSNGGTSNSGTTVSSTSNNPSNHSNSIINKKLPLPRSGEKSRSVNTNSSLVSPPKVQHTSDIYEDKTIEWQNITGFLAALGGCCLVNVEASVDMDEVRDVFQMFSTSSKPIAIVDRFIGEMTEMLVSENVYISEGIKDTLGNDLSPALYVLLFQHLEKRLSKCFDSNGSAIRGPQNKMFIEQSVLVLRLILDRLVNPRDCLLNIDFSTLIHQFADYLNKVPNTYITLRIKVKMCLLIETVMQKKEQIVLRDEMRIRNWLLGICVEWTSEFASQRKPVEVGQQIERLQKDLDHSCLKAIVSLLHQLPLQPFEAIRPVDTLQIKSKLFLKYFSFFRKLLDKFKQIERERSKYSINGTNGHHLNPRDSALKSSLNTNDTYQDISHMKELTIIAMSHLLSANVEAGLKYSLTMGYDDDQETRKAFMQVLTNILDQGTEFENLAENIMVDRYEKLIDMLVDADMEIVMSLCDVCSSQDTTGVAEILITCFESREKVMSLLKAVVQKEISLTEQEATLFRGSTIATRILSIFARQACVDYIRVTLQPAMMEINELPDHQISWELDPQRVTSMEQVMKNKQNVIRATEILLNAICSSIDSTPRLFREELSLISSAVGERFPEAKYTAVGSFVFLRLFGPAILSPETAGFSKKALPRNPHVRKILLQATRIMQNLANNILFGSKETHMIILNDFLTSNIYKVTNFLRAMSTLPPKKANNQEAVARMDQNGYIRLHKYLSNNLERMSRNLTSRKYIKEDNIDTQILLSRKRTIDRLSTLLAQLGRPSDINTDIYARAYTNEPNTNYYNSDYSRKNKDRDLSSFKSQNIFYLGGVSKQGRPVFNYIVRRMDSEENDVELLIYYMLQVLEPYLNNPFEILFDLSNFGRIYCIPIQWMTQFFQLVFSEMNDYLVAIHLFNPNAYLEKYILQLPLPVVNKVIKRARFYTTIAELTENIAPSQIKLPKETVDFEKESGVIISPAYEVTNFRTTIPVTIKIGREYIQIITAKKQQVAHKVETLYNHVLHIKEIEDIIAIHSSRADTGGELSFKYDKGKATMVLASPKRDVILNNLYSLKERYEASKPNSMHERSIRPNDVPGRLLNMALLNVGSEDPELRLAAYNLLYSLSLSFRFNVGNQLLNAKDLCIPANSSSFIVNISESLANSEVHLTLEFLNEALAGFSKASESMRQTCLDYMTPWLKNLGMFAGYSTDDQKKNLSKSKDIIRAFIDMTIRRPELYKHIQTRIWKTISEEDEIINLVIDTFVKYSIESGVGSTQAERIADTMVTMSSVNIRGKVISRMRRVIESTSAQPCRSLTEHPSWDEMAVLLRFILMLSFNNTSPIVTYVPEIFHIVTVLVATGPTLIRSSIHELVVNTIHTLCTMSTPLVDENVKKLHFLLNDLCDSRTRVSFGLTKQHANAFTITKETTSDFIDSMDLASIQNIVRILMDAMNFGAPTTDVANMWRARWMGLVTSTAFYFNPAVQPRSFVTLGCLAQDEVDDDLIYQILVALKGALAIFNESDSSLISSIMMCLSNVIDSLPSDSRYMLQLFWLAVALVQIGHPGTFQTAVQFLQSVLRALESRKYFVQYSIEDVLLRSRVELNQAASELDNACGVNFNNYFSFAVTCILLRGLKQCDNKDIVFQCLSTFLEIDCKRPIEQGLISAKTLGYFAGLLPFSVKDDALIELLRLAGLSEVELDAIDYGSLHTGLFAILDIPDNSTALLLISLLVNLLNASENESEKLFLYTILADAAESVPDVFALVYESLLPKMNQIVVNSHNHDVIEAIKSILVTACSEPAFNIIAQNLPNKPTQKLGLESLKFTSLFDPTFGAIKTNVSMNAKLASRLLGCITDQQ